MSRLNIEGGNWVVMGKKLGGNGEIGGKMAKIEGKLGLNRNNHMERSIMWTEKSIILLENIHPS